MKRVIFCIILPLAVWIASNAKLDLPGRDMLKGFVGKEYGIEEVRKYTPVIAKIEDEEALTELAALGAVIMNRRDELVLAWIPDDRIEDAAELVSVSRISVGAGMHPFMDKARVMGNVDKIAAGLELPRRYDGEGVVVGFSDIGFDPNHVNFRDESGDRTRVKRLVSYVDTLAQRIDISTAEDLQSWTTDTDSEWHATHVAGILAGSYSDNGYQGVATASEIVATTSGLSDACILAGVEDVIAYAKACGKPAVVNLSLGSYTGPHDGSDLFCQYLDRLGKEAVICIAAGNEGHHNNVVLKDFTSSDDMLKTFVFDHSWVGIDISGISDFWSRDSRRFQVALCIYDTVENEMLYTSGFMGGEDGPLEWGIASPELATESDETNDVFDRCFSGYLRLYGELNQENSRYNVLFSYDVRNKDYKGEWGRYCPGLIIKGDAGVHVDGYADGVSSFFRSMGAPGFVNGQTDGSISNIACGHNVIVVGACNSRNQTPLVGGGDAQYGFAEGAVAAFTGYGTLLDGRVLPHFCAPGNMVVSSVSTPYVANREAEYVQSLSAGVTVGGKDYYWIADCGTSMSTPYAAGVFALWLQADPTLTVEDIRDVAITTARRDAADIGDPKWGAGALDAYEGLKTVLSRSGIGNADNDSSNRVIVTDGGTGVLRVTVVGAHEVRASLYSLTGAVVASSPDTGGEDACIGVTGLQSGVYVLVVESDVCRHVDRVVIR